MHLINSEIYLKYSDVLDAEKLVNLRKLAQSLRDKFIVSNTNDKDLVVKPGVKYRKSMLLNPRNFPEYKKFFKDLLYSNLSFFCSFLGINEFEPEDIQIQLTMHNDGDYYLWHRDEVKQKIHGRKITFVYYFNFEPKMFTGGELAVYPPGSKPVILQPENNTMIIFNPTWLHEVKPVSCPGKVFENSRFTLTGWIINKDIDQISQEEEPI